MRRLLKSLGDPQDSLPPVIHVAGTNGKGSTIATLRACFEAAGCRVHTTTSPHLVRFNERIRLAGDLIGEEALVEVLEECESANAGEPITFFEITQAAAFLAFARVPADVALVEVGLGGRFDATNVLTRPAATVITPVSLDHQHFLGDTVAAIAFEKAGILKCGSPAIVGPQQPEGLAVIEARAQEVGAPLHRFGREWTVEPKGTGLYFEGARWRLDLPPPSLFGRHQIDNAGTALACLEMLPQFHFRMETLAQGLYQIEWPGRLQRLRKGPLAELLPKGWELWLDGAHNQAGGEALAQVAESWGDRPLHLVVGMKESHDLATFLRAIAPSVASLGGIAIPDEPNIHSPEAIVDAARKVGIEKAVSFPSTVAAEAAILTEKKPGRILICGSLYLAGRVLAENG